MSKEKTAPQIMESIEKAVTPYRGRRKQYQMSVEELFIMGQYAKEYPLETIAAIFDYGFVKGVKYQKEVGAAV